MKVYLLAKVGWEDFHPRAVYKSLEQAAISIGGPRVWLEQKSDYGEVSRCRGAFGYEDAVIYELDYRG